MKINPKINISVRIIIICAAAFLYSFIPEKYDYFGDTICKGRIWTPTTEKNDAGYYYPGNYSGCTLSISMSEHEPTRHWGYRHYIFALCGVCLSLVQVVGIFQVIQKASE